MPATVRFAPIYINNKKVAELENVSYDIMSGDEQIITTEGWSGATDGAITCKASADCITPVAGVAVDFIGAMLNKQYVDVGIPWNGRIHKFTARVTGSNMSSDPKSGKTSGKFALDGGALKVVG